MVTHWANVMIGTLAAGVEEIERLLSLLKRWAEGPIGSRPGRLYRLRHWAMRTAAVSPGHVRRGEQMWESPPRLPPPSGGLFLLIGRAGGSPSGLHGRRLEWKRVVKRL